jgi:aerobic carbon-monoxide dehydrogenase medium subunit
VKPARFAYHDPTTLDEALDLLALYGEEARLLAGGQSLIPLLNFRLARPAHLVDLNRISELGLMHQAGDGLVLGAMVRQRTLERSPVLARVCPLIGQAMPLVGHAQIRNRGTLGGSLAHADPAAELPAVMLAADATLTLARKGAQRTVAADDFFVGALRTAAWPGEALVQVTIPPWPSRTGSSIQEVAIRRGDFALAGVVSVLSLDVEGRIARARIVCFGVEEFPRRQLEAEKSLEGTIPSDGGFAEAGRIVSARVRAVEDIHASAAYRARVAGSLTARALTASAALIPEPVA